MVATTARTACFAPRNPARLADLLLSRRELVTRSAGALRGEVADAMSQRDLSDLFDHEDPSADPTNPRLWEVEEALARVADGTHGYCADCGIGIPLARLRVLPATARCVGCRRRYHLAGTLDEDGMRSTKSQGRSLVGSGTSVRRDER